MFLQKVACTGLLLSKAGDLSSARLSKTLSGNAIAACKPASSGAKTPNVVLQVASSNARQRNHIWQADS